MGSWVSTFLDYFSGERQVRILFLGLDAAGKTTILYRLKLGSVIRTCPTIGFNVETLRYKKLQFTVWDIGGQAKIRPLWTNFLQNSAALVWVVDCADRSRITESAEELAMLLADKALSSCPLLVFANKQDMEGSMTVEEIRESLKLHELCDFKRIWHVQRAAAEIGQGICEGMEWLAQAVTRPELLHIESAERPRRRRGGD